MKGRLVKPPFFFPPSCAEDQLPVVNGLRLAEKSRPSAWSGFFAPRPSPLGCCLLQRRHEACIHEVTKSSGRPEARDLSGRVHLFLVAWLCWEYGIIWAAWSKRPLRAGALFRREAREGEEVFTGARKRQPTQSHGWRARRARPERYRLHCQPL